MPTIFTHPAVPLAMRFVLGRRLVSAPLLLAGVFASILPDFDVIGFSFGIPYGSPYGHRGLTHSVFFALLVALAAARMSRRLGSSPWPSFWFVFLATVSHGVLDAFTTGGMGIAFLWPFSAERFFAPVRLIEVSPLSLSGLMSPRGLAVLQSELLWVWLPALAVAIVAALIRRR